MRTDDHALSATPVLGFVTDVCHVEETGEFMVMIAFNQHEHHYVLTRKMAEELVIGLRKGLAGPEGVEEANET